MLGSHIMTNRLNDIAPVFTSFSFGFSDNNQTFASFNIDSKTSDGTILQTVTRAFYCEFNILRITIDSTDNNQILETTCHKEIITLYKSEVSGTQEWTGLAISQFGFKGLLRQSRFIPVATSDTGAINPNFADFT